MSLLLPTDDNGHPISLLGFNYRGTQKLAVGNASVRNAPALPEAVQVVTLLATGPCRFEVGGAEVTADPALSPYLAPGQYVDVPLRAGEHHVACIAEGSPCSVYVMGRR